MWHSFHRLIVPTGGCYMQSSRDLLWLDCRDYASDDGVTAEPARRAIGVDDGGDDGARL